MDPNTLICPYNKSHVISKERIQFHLTKCRKNYPSDEKVQCTFNTTHIVNKPELEYHELNCPNRDVIDRYFFQVGDTHCLVKDMIPINSVEMPECNEDWDAEESTVDVIDMLREQASTKNCLRYMAGTTKSKRKEFRLQERARHQQLEESGRKQIKEEPRPSSSSYGAYKKTDPVLPRHHKTNSDLMSLHSVKADTDLSSFVSRGRGRARDVDDLTKNLKKVEVREVDQGDLAQIEMSDKNISEKKSYSTIASRGEGDQAKNTKPNFNFPITEEGFCQLPIPGMGRGRRRNL